MGSTSKGFSLLFVIMLAVLSLMTIESVFAQSISKPSVPEFTVAVDDHSYYEPATTPSYYTDPYTGEKHLLTEGQDGYPVQNGTIDLTVNTQKFDSYYDSADHLIRLYYRVAYKGHFEPGWNYYPHYSGFYGNESQYFQASISGTNEVRFGFGHFSFYYGEDNPVPPSFGDIKEGGKIDFKVEALIGYSNRSEYATPMGLKSYDAYIGESSGWSNTQTLTISDSPTPSPEPQPEPFPTAFVVAASIAAVVVGAGLLVYFKKRSGGQPA